MKVKVTLVQQCQSLVTSTTVLMGSAFTDIMIYILSLSVLLNVFLAIV